MVVWESTANYIGGQEKLENSPTHRGPHEGRCSISMLPADQATLA